MDEVFPGRRVGSLVQRTKDASKNLSRLKTWMRSTQPAPQLRVRLSWLDRELSTNSLADRYVLRSCSRNILGGYNPIYTFTIGRTSPLEAFRSHYRFGNRLKTVNVPVLEPILRYKYGCSPLE